MFEKYKPEFDVFCAFRFPWSYIKNSGREWNWKDCSRNRSLTWQDVIDNPQIPWNFEFLSMNPCVTWDIVQRNPGLPWDFDTLLANENLTLDILEQNPGLLSGNRFFLSANPNLTWEFVRKNVHLNWDFECLSTLEFVNWEEIEKNPSIPWSFESLAHEVPAEVIMNYPEVFTNREYQSSNPHIIDQILENPRLGWDLFEFSRTVPWLIFLHNQDFPWDYNGLSDNPQLCWEFVVNHPDRPWNYSSLASNGMGRSELEQREKEVRKLLGRYYAKKFYAKIQKRKR